MNKKTSNPHTNSKMQRKGMWVFKQEWGYVDYMDYINAFWVGGAVCALAQVFLDRTKMLPGRVMVLLVCTGAVISFFGWYEAFAEYAGAGANVPLLGYGNILMKGVKEAVDKDGFIGLFKGGFTSGAVGCSAALVFGYLASLVFHSKVTRA